jgi:predicted ester cyclase
LTPEDTIAEGGKVAVRLAFRGVHKGAPGELFPAGMMRQLG